MGAQFGTASYLWIVFGTIFAGAVHDFCPVPYRCVTMEKVFRKLSVVI